MTNINDEKMAAQMNSHFFLKLPSFKKRSYNKKRN